MALPLREYDHIQIEDKWYHFWEKAGYFHADEKAVGESYSIVIPPPNITGSLHMGHALNNTLQDVLIRWKRMQGFNTLWMPGTDHAGIATQNVVERQLQKEGLSREQIGREEFLRLIWKWREESGRMILAQLRKLGASCDWERERFTLDEGLSQAVREVFCQLYEAGLVYRGDYIINWCPHCRTALSDLEVDHRAVMGKLYHIHYPLASGGAGIVVATTRPETMLGDTAVAVNPKDHRYSEYVGCVLTLPAAGRKIPIIADSYVAMEFGTGAVKVTPAHDLNDFEIGLRHRLPTLKVIGEDGTMTAGGRKVSGLEPFGLPRASSGGFGEARLSTKDGGLRPFSRPLLSLRGHDRADAVPAMVRADEASGGTGHRCGRGRQDSNHPFTLGEDLLRVDGEYPRLVHLSPDLVGASHPGVVLPGLRGGDRLPPRDHAVFAVSGQSFGTGDRRPGYVVQFGPLAIFHHGLASSDTCAEAFLPYLGAGNGF